MLDTQKQINRFAKTLDFEIRGDYIQFSYDEKLREYLEEEDIAFEQIRLENIHIKYEDLGFVVFENPSKYLTISNVKKKPDVLILYYDENHVLSKIQETYYKDFKPIENFFFFSNAKYFLAFIEFLKSQDKETEDAFHFIDYANDVNRKIVLTSITEKSRLILKYDKKIPQTSEEADLSKGYELFISCFSEENMNLPKFLKSSLIKFASRYEENHRLNLLFQNLKSVVEDARINFEIHINNLSIDKIRKDYDDYKSKYFAEVSDILKKISQQLIGFPIVISSTLFAVEKVKTNPTFLWILAFAIFITTIYLILLLRMNFRDLMYVDQLSEKDFQTLKDNKFFNKFPDELKIFKQIKTRISTRVKNLNIVCESYFWILSFANTALICVMLSYLKIPFMGIVLIALAILFAMVISRNKIWGEKNIA